MREDSIALKTRAAATRIKGINCGTQIGNFQAVLPRLSRFFP
jgi:hypothetical protein